MPSRNFGRSAIRQFGKSVNRQVGKLAKGDERVGASIALESVMLYGFDDERCFAPD
ncbi:MAG: hypothetical protein ACK4I8_09295 [Armatimonadota bacterium]